MLAATDPPYVLALQRAFDHVSREEPEQALTSLHLALAELRGKPADTIVYELIASLTALSGEREAAIDFLVAAQARHPDLPLSCSPDFRLRQRQAIARGLPALLLITQFKSASVFLARTLAKGLDLPTCYVACAPLSERIVPDWLALFARGGALAQNHLLPSRENLAALEASPLRRVVVHIRDPRQSMISAVHHYTDDYRRSSPAGMLTRAEFPAGFADWPNEQKIEYYLHNRFPADVAWTAGWLEVAQNPPPGLDIRLTNFETFRRDLGSFIAGLLGFWQIPPSAFDWSALRMPSAGKLHFRKGEATEWRRVLTAKQAARATALLPPAVADYFAALT